VARPISETQQHGQIFDRRTKITNPSSNSKPPPRAGGDRYEEKLQQQKAQKQTLFRETHGVSNVAAFGSLHGSTTATRITPASSWGWPEIPHSNLPVQTLFGGMTLHLVLTSAAACHQQYTARKRKLKVWWIWSLGYHSLPSYSI
jgi:hypothetical protein